MDTRFGPEAKDGDYCLVLEHNYRGNRSTVLPAKVHNGKAYTGVTYPTALGKRYIHKTTAQVVIPASYVPDEIKEKIEEDIKIHS